MDLPRGYRIGHYEITQPLGEGGMGRVYRGRDTRLDRSVAIKVMQDAIRSSPSAVSRFEREARTLASLSHPHVCAIHDAGRHNGFDFLVMELLDGQTLAERLRSGRLPLDQLLRYALQISEALAEAHRNGIIHRDLKPANVMLTKSGVKVLDFGLAKMAERVPDNGSATTIAMTAEGTLLGTIPYMAPEQLQGSPGDARTDIFALGAVLYEMATGKPAFQGQNQASLIAAIMTSQPPPIREGDSSLPQSLERVIGTCLARNPDERWQSATDLCHALRWVEPPADVAVLHKVTPRRAKLGLAAALIIAAAAAAGIAAFTAAKSRVPAVQARALRLSLPEAFPPDAGVPAFGKVEISPDGRRLAFISGGRVHVRAFASMVSQPLSGTEGVRDMFWSPDSAFLSFAARGKLKKVEVASGAIHDLAESPLLRGGSWNSKGAIIFSPDNFGAIYKIPETGGSPEQVTTINPVDETRHWDPIFLPDGRHFLYRSRGPDPGLMPILLGDIERKEPPRRILEATGRTAYASGHLVFARGSTIYAQPFDLNGFRLYGSATPLAEQAHYYAMSGLTSFSVSDDMLIYRGGGPRGVDFIRVDLGGKPVAASRPETTAALYQTHALSPDGTLLILERVDHVTGNSDLWIRDLTRGSTSPLTRNPGMEQHPVWSPDGRQFAFQRVTGGSSEIVRRALDSGESQTILRSPRRTYPTDWTADGRWILYETPDDRSKHDLWMIAADGKQAPVPLVQSPFNERMGQFSPDGKWLAYMSDESGRDEVFVRGVSSSAVRVMISTQGGVQPRWSRDGKTLYYKQGSTLYAMPVEAGPATFRAGSPERLFEHASLGLQNAHMQYSVSEDGRTFLVRVSPEPAGAETIHALVNWAAALRH